MATLIDAFFRGSFHKGGYAASAKLSRFSSKRRALFCVNIKGLTKDFRCFRTICRGGNPNLHWFQIICRYGKFWILKNMLGFTILHRSKFLQNRRTSRYPKQTSNRQGCPAPYKNRQRQKLIVSRVLEIWTHARKTQNPFKKQKSSSNPGRGGNFDKVINQ